MLQQRGQQDADRTGGPVEHGPDPLLRHERQRRQVHELVVNLLVGGGPVVGLGVGLGDGVAVLLGVDGEHPGAPLSHTGHEGVLHGVIQVVVRVVGVHAGPAGR